MSNEDIKNKNIVLCSYLDSIIDGYEVKAEYSTNANSEAKMVVVQETSGEKEIFYDANPIYNYYTVEISGDSIKSAKDVSVEIGNLIGQDIYYEWTTGHGHNQETQKWQIIIKQFANPRTIEYMDIRRVAYVLTLQAIVNRIA